jgi:hypothetical protein
MQPRFLQQLIVRTQCSRKQVRAPTGQQPIYLQIAWMAQIKTFRAVSQ